MAWTSPKTWADQDVLTYEEMNTYIRDNWNAIGTLTEYTPTWTATVSNPSVGTGGLLKGWYAKLEHWCFVQIAIVMGTASSAGNGGYTLSLPFQVANETFTGSWWHLAGQILNSGTARYSATAELYPGASTFFVTDFSAWAFQTGQVWSSTNPFAMGWQDSFSCTGWYRVA